MRQYLDKAAALNFIADTLIKHRRSSLTKREQIAAMAMQGIVPIVEEEFEGSVQYAAARALAYADALLSELAKPQEGGAS